MKRKRENGKKLSVNERNKPDNQDFEAYSIVSSMKDKVHPAYSRKQSVLTSTKMKIKLFIMASWLPL